MQQPALPLYGQVVRLQRQLYLSQTSSPTPIGDPFRRLATVVNVSQTVEIAHYVAWKLPC